MISLRVPAGSCHVIASLRVSTSRQKSTTHSRFRIAVRSWKGKFVAPYFLLYASISSSTSLGSRAYQRVVHMFGELQ